MTVRVYSWDDVGAPELIMVNPTGNTSFGLERLKQVLKACLVDGYGNKEPAGWSMGHEVEGGFSLFNGDGYFAFAYGGNTNWLRLYTLDDITDGSSPVPIGPNRRTGWQSDTYPSGTPFSLNTSNNMVSFSYRYHARWVVVADEHTAYLSYAGHSSVSESSLPTTAAGITNPLRSILCLGRSWNDLDEPMGVFGGGCISTSFSATYPWAFQHGASWSSSHNPSTGGVEQGSNPYLSPLNMNILSANRTEISSLQAISLFPMQLGWWYGNSGVTGVNNFKPAGRLRGVFGVYPLNGLRWDLAFNIVSQSTLQDFWTQPMRPFELNGKEYLAFGNWLDHSYPQFALISTDEADWQ